jgi:hypothetical protein
MAILAWLIGLLSNLVVTLLFAGVAYLLVLLILPPRDKRINIRTADAVGEVFFVLVTSGFLAWLILAACSLILLVGGGIATSLGIMDNIHQTTVSARAAKGNGGTSWQAFFLAYGGAYLLALCVNLFQLRRSWVVSSGQPVPERIDSVNRANSDLP